MPSNSQRSAFSVFNGFAPTEGPKALPIQFDFSAATSFDVNLLTENTNGVIQFVQSIWVENHNNPSPLVITFQGTGQIIKVPAFAQGCWPVFSTDQVVFNLSTLQNAAAIGKVILLNVPMASFTV